MLLAVREAVYSAAGLTEDIDIAPRKRPEATGAAAETRRGAAGGGNAAVPRLGAGVAGGPRPT